MRLFFFTSADDYYRQAAEILIASGKRFGREIHFFEMPAGEMWNRYKVKLLSGDLPPADKYIYLDADTVMTCEGDWESEECIGVADMLYYMEEKKRLEYTMSFIRNHTCVVGEGKGYEYVCQLWREFNFPVWCNSGVVVLPAEVRVAFMECWRQWMENIDSHCEKGFIEGDEYPLVFARQEFGLPFLPPRFNGMCKAQPIYDWHVLIHADGNVSGEKRLPYTKAVERILDGQEKAKD